MCFLFWGGDRSFWPHDLYDSFPPPNSACAFPLPMSHPPTSPGDSAFWYVREGSRDEGCCPPRALRPCSSDLKTTESDVFSLWGGDRSFWPHDLYDSFPQLCLCLSPAHVSPPTSPGDSAFWYVREGFPVPPGPCALRSSDGRFLLQTIPREEVEVLIGNTARFLRV